MKKAITAIVAIILTVFGLTLIPASTYATTDICSQAGVSNEVRKANGCGGASSDLSATVVNILNGIIGILGVIAVVFIVVGGVNYMTSAGDAGKVEKAKKTILYAAVGLAICALAFAIVNFFVNILNNA
jgi:hypothetical protein